MSLQTKPERLKRIRSQLTEMSNVVKLPVFKLNFKLRGIINNCKMNIVKQLAGAVADAWDAADEAAAAEPRSIGPLHISSATAMNLATAALPALFELDVASLAIWRGPNRRRFGFPYVV